MAQTIASQYVYPTCPIIIGRLQDSDYGGLSLFLAAEKEPLRYNSMIYHYLTVDGLRYAQTIGISSGCQCLSVEEMARSLNTMTPHYGDGAYSTLVSDLHTAPQAVTKAHGIDMSQRNYRAVFYLKDPSQFIKIPFTGGVILMVRRDPPNSTNERNYLWRRVTGAVELISLEQRVNATWKII